MMDGQQEYQDYFSYEYGCELCHQAPIDRSENPNSKLCKACREKAIRYPVPKKIWIAAVIVLLLVAAAMIRFPRVLKDYKIYTTAESRIRQGELYGALDDLLEVVERYPDSVDLSGRLALLSYRYGCYDYTAYAIDNYLVGKEVSDMLYRSLDKAVEMLDCYYTTIETVQGIGEGLDEGQSQEEIVTVLKEGCLALLEEEGQYPALLYYYLAMFSEDSGEQKQYLEQCLELDPMIREAQTDLGTVKRRMGDMAGAEACYAEVLSLDGTNASALRGRAILRMLEGDMEQGLRDAAYAYEVYPDAAYLRETYMIALALSGDQEGSRRLRQEILDLGGTIEEDTEQVLSGEMTLDAYYIGE